ncbi:hypothetical protein E0H73_40095 [Kribbella pittospori]|uniref:Uncharacterized protein n=1 Tax=Kribbella pittospori TaxID=722689 RepID=A0A4R0JX93_9ACTN|nr:hypothetical protein [Kribbella pittospori]TCC52141.1 hypothetical protein E0H73_40095 [Kribbella pittospori]
MRATYEDLLRAARRTAVNAHLNAVSDGPELITDWEVVLAATVRHLRWLRGGLVSIGHADQRLKGSDSPLGRLATAIGAGADMLATQDPATVSALDQREDLAAARAEIGAIALIGAKVVLRSIHVGSPGFQQFLTVMLELDHLARSDTRRAGLGALGGLTAGGPPVPGDRLSLISWHAARWERAHDAVPARTLLTRDLRSTTAQLRTVCGHAWHLASHLRKAATADLDTCQRLDLAALMKALRAFDTGAAVVTDAWRRRVSDVGGRSNAPAEVVFLELQATLAGVVRHDRRLLSPDALVPNGRVAARLLDVVDELMWSADQVARKQQEAVAGLILHGRLFVPQREAKMLEVAYPSRRGRTGMHPRARWVRTNLPNHFEQLTDALTWSSEHLGVASEIARRLTGTSNHARPAGKRHGRIPAPYLDPTTLRRAVAGPGFPDPGQEPVDLVR